MYKQSAAILLLTAFIAGLLYRCGPGVNAAKKTHYLDSTLSREKQVEKCGSCHKEVYNDWLSGPHAYAYTGLLEHKRYVSGSANFPDVYKPFLNKNTDQLCASCHSGDNIFESNFKGIGLQTPMDSVTTANFPEAYKPAHTRPAATAGTGVDCITCHVQNQRVLTLNTSKASADSGIYASNLFSNNQACNPCHHHQVQTMNELVKDGQLPAPIGCNDCHLQTNATTGKRRHYYYWRKDPADKVRPGKLVIFEDIKVTLSGRRLAFSWKNTRMPHDFSECGDALCIVRLVYKNGKKVKVLEHNLNRRNYFCERGNMPPHFSLGKSGNEFKYGAFNEQEVIIPRSPDLVAIEISGYTKPQYWSNEKEYSCVYTKTLSPGNNAQP